MFWDSIIDASLDILAPSQVNPLCDSIHKRCLDLLLEESLYIDGHVKKKCQKHVVSSFLSFSVAKVDLWLWFPPPSRCNYWTFPRWQETSVDWRSCSSLSENQQSQLWVTITSQRTGDTIHRLSWREPVHLQQVRQGQAERKPRKKKPVSRDCSDQKVWHPSSPYSLGLC